MLFLCNSRFLGSRGYDVTNAGLPRFLTPLSYQQHPIFFRNFDFCESTILILANFKFKGACINNIHLLNYSHNY
jgi:hypothetical protein